MEKEIIIDKCFCACPFYGSNNDGMYCGHPYFKGIGAYEDMIITHDNSHNGKIPKKCPLRKESLTISYTLKK